MNREMKITIYSLYDVIVPLTLLFGKSSFASLKSILDANDDTKIKDRNKNDNKLYTMVDKLLIINTS